MRPIIKPNGEIYCWVEVSDNILKIKLNNGSSKGMILHLDAKIIPQLKQILTEAEILNYVT